MTDDDDKKVPPLVQRREANARKQGAAGKHVLPRHLEGLAPSGTGPTNRHGMPQLPPGQRRVPNWPVLDLGDQPLVTREQWRLEIDGLVERPRVGEGAITFDDLMNFPQVDEESDFHCVTTWSRMDMKFGGVRLRDVLDGVGLRDGAAFLLVHGHDEDASSGEHYTTNVALHDATQSDVLLVHTWEGKPLPREHGGPVRMVTPQLYAWKGTKWIKRIDVLDHDELGFWERRGYSNSAIPWYDDRYSRR
jgi:DMSO/TMAO reductase YedYZ molybdopterin-dependent catalytic subunit